MKLFGTDGIRAPFGTYPLDRPTVTRLGSCLGEILLERSAQPVVVLGGDTRESTPQLCSWIETGLRAAGADCLFGGVLPTPAVASLVGHLRADAGVAISASHNPLPDNGIKIFNHHGYKASPAAEERLEQSLFRDSDRPTADDRELEPDPELAEAYLTQLVEIAAHENIDLTGMRVVVDSGNGAATPFARRLFEELGAVVVSMGDSPDGTNINRDCGSTAPETMARAVVENRADLGIAFDGDADRAILADETGEIRDGDAALYLWAKALHERSALDPPAIVATSMSNLGLEVALEAEGVEVVRCDVGDRTVVNTMIEQGICLGGEQSGHIIHLGTGTTGDGLLTGVQIAGIGARAEAGVSRLLTDLRRYPQVLLNVRVASKPDLESLPSIASAARSVEERLGDRGRLVLRYSGTEPLARVMIEGADQESISSMAAEIVEAIRSEIGES